MQGVFAAEAAVLVHFKSVRITLLVFLSVIVSLLAFRAGERNLDSHFCGTSYLNLELSLYELAVWHVPPSVSKRRRFSPKKARKKDLSDRGTAILSYFLSFVKCFFVFF